MSDPTRKTETVSLATSSSAPVVLDLATVMARRRYARSGKIGWALLWLLGVPLPVLLVLYLIRGH